MRYLFYINHNYCFEILRPLQSAMLAGNHQVKWFVAGNFINVDLFNKDEDVLDSVEDAITYSPHACFVPGNEIPRFIPGLKVQVFHGLEWKKKGHFGIRGFFDLYCTHGPATTSRFNLLAKKHGYFDVIETGWPKLDTLFNATPLEALNDRKVILYAPTFSPKLTSAPALFEKIKERIGTGDQHWLIKFHPKMDPLWIEKYKTLASERCEIVHTGEINALLQRADIMISDTSSVIGEFALLNKPIITLNNSEPGEYLINITSPESLNEAIEQALAPSETLLEEIDEYAKSLHPYQDGQSSNRILDSVNKIIEAGKKSKKRKPLNLFREFKLRRQLNYWRLH